MVIHTAYRVILHIICSLILHAISRFKHGIDMGSLGDLLNGWIIELMHDSLNETMNDSTSDFMNDSMNSSMDVLMNDLMIECAI